MGSLQVLASPQCLSVGHYVSLCPYTRYLMCTYGISLGSLWVPASHNVSPWVPYVSVSIPTLCVPMEILWGLYECQPAPSFSRSPTYVYVHTPQQCFPVQALWGLYGLQQPLVSLYGSLCVSILTPLQLCPYGVSMGSLCDTTPANVSLWDPMYLHVHTPTPPPVCPYGISRGSLLVSAPSNVSLWVPMSIPPQ